MPRSPTRRPLPSPQCPTRTALKAAFDPNGADSPIRPIKYSDAGAGQKKKALSNPADPRVGDSPLKAKRRTSHRNVPSIRRSYAAVAASFDPSPTTTALPDSVPIITQTQDVSDDAEPTSASTSKQSHVSPSTSCCRQKFVPVWRALGQNRYEERHWRQLEELLLNKNYHRLETLRRSRTSNPYGGKSGKGHLAIDEAIELMNRFMTQMGHVRSMESFARQGNYVGMAKMSKRFVQAINKMEEDNTTQKVYRTGASPRRLQERKMIYEIFMLMGTHEYVPGRKFTRRSISDLKLKTKLVDVRRSRTKKKGHIHDSAFQLLSSIGQVMDDVALIKEKNDDHDDVAVTKELDEREKRDDVGAKETTTLEKEIENLEASLLDDDGNRCTDDTMEEPKKDDTRKDDDKISKQLGYNRFMIDDVWKVGKERLEKANIKKEREDARARLQRKRDTNRAIVERFQQKKNEASAIKADIECDVPWRYPDNY